MNRQSPSFAIVILYTYFRMMILFTQFSVLVVVVIIFVSGFLYLLTDTVTCEQSKR